MCTLSWRESEQGLEIFFNRDELKTRSRAEPPRLFTSPSGTRYLAPIDPDGGGSWMAANEQGLLICLLNRWHQDAPLATRSRGAVILSLIDCQRLEEVANLLPDLIASTKPFDLIAFSRGKARGETIGYSWDGLTLTPFAPQRPLTSSSYCFEKVQATRLANFSENNGDLETYHSHPNQSPSAYTVRMNRPDAQTWSRSLVTISPKGIDWQYWEEFPDLANPSQLHRANL